MIDGVGLGLSITREIVQMLGGTINVSSRKGSGSKFKVVIPVEVLANSAPVIATAKIDNNKFEEAATVSHDAKEISVLIVDDDKLQQQLLTEMFSRMEGISLNVVTTTHANEAIRLANKIKPRIVFTDIEMPEMNGSEIMRRIRSNMTATFVAMTAHEQSIMPQLRKDGFDACLFKPFNVQTLAATICQLTGIIVKVKTESTAMKTDSLRSALLPFTDGDPEAERQIIDDIHKSIDEYLDMLKDASDADQIAKAAHKAMPLLEMIQPGKNSWLTPLTLEHIGETEEKEREKLTIQLVERLKQIKNL